MPAIAGIFRQIVANVELIARVLLALIALLAAPAAAQWIAIDANFPDPTVVRASDGSYYAYGTQGNGSNIQVAHSPDLKTWTRLPDALPVKPRWASRTQDFWAPDVIAANGRYYLYYSAKPDVALTNKTAGLCLAVAVASQPQGHFVDKGAPLLCGAGFVNIDPMAYDDPVSGKRLLYWGSGFEPIRVRQLAPDRLSFAAGTVARDLVSPARTGFPRLVEGAWMHRRDGWYYLFYSGDNCCGKNASYALMVARSHSATGPFETLEEATGKPHSVVLVADARWLAPGHNSVVTDAQGQDWVAYHAVDRQRPRASEKDEVNTRRVMLLARLTWRNGWPEVAKGER